MFGAFNNIDVTAGDRRSRVGGFGRGRAFSRGELRHDRFEQLRRQIDRELTQREVQPGQPVTLK